MDQAATIIPAGRVVICIPGNGSDERFAFQSLPVVNAMVEMLIARTAIRRGPLWVH